MRGEIFQINGKSFFAFGGAESHDKEYRTSGKTWWTDEMPSADEYKNAISNISFTFNNDGKINPKDFDISSITSYENENKKGKKNVNITNKEKMV